MLETALALAKLGLYVFPVNHTEDNKKVPYTKNGLHDSSTHERAIRQWWEQYPEAKIGVHAGPSNILVLDVDVKNGKDGWDSLDFFEVPDTFWYETSTGGSHYVYAAPDETALNGEARYRGLEGVDRRGGNSFVMWVGGVPSSRDEFTDAPEWLCDPAKVRSAEAFEGGLKEWFELLQPGGPNALVRKAIQSVHYDMSHSEMISAQFHAIRLGAEGNAGVPDLLAALEEAWLNRPEENHSTPETDWAFKFAEGLYRGIEKYGDPIKLLADIRDFHPGEIPTSVQEGLLVGSTEASKAEWARALDELMDSGADDATVLTMLWGSPRTSPLSKDWGPELVHKRIAEARKSLSAPEGAPVARVSPEFGTLELLSPEEKERIEGQPTFEMIYTNTAKASGGFVNETLFRAGSWNVLSCALAFHGHLPVPEKHRFNMWFTTLAPSGTGKTTGANFERRVIDMLYIGDNEEQPHRIGHNISPQGLHQALLNRDKQLTFMHSDESAAFFKSIANDRFMASALDEMNGYYDGLVPPSNKVNSAHLKGKSALTSFNIHLRSTEDVFLSNVTADLFKTGFLARMNWVIGPDIPHKKDSDRMTEIMYEAESLESHPPLDMELAVFLKTLQAIYPATLGVGTHLSNEYAGMHRLDRCLNDLKNFIRGHEHEDILEPAITRLRFETLPKAASMTALFRGSKTIREMDALIAINQVQEWFDNLLYISSRISESIFSQQCRDITDYILSRKGQTATRSEIYQRFKHTVKRPLELEERITMLREMGTIVVEAPEGKSTAIKYRANV